MHSFMHAIMPAFSRGHGQLALPGVEVVGYQTVDSRAHSQQLV